MTRAALHGCSSHRGRFVDDWIRRYKLDLLVLARPTNFFHSFSMLAWILDQFAYAFPDANWTAATQALEKITLRAALAAMASFFMAVAIGPRAIRLLERRFREPLDQRSPQLSQINAHKQATPTMGGLFIV